MAADDPIRIGSAATAALIAESGSRIATDDFGVQHGTITHWLGDQSLAQSSRFALGAAYSGSLPQYSGFYVEKSGDITGIDGKCAELDVQLAKIDPLWQTLPRVKFDLELKQMRLGDLAAELAFMESLFTLVIPIPHPVIDLTFGSATRPNQIGSYGTPSGAPSVGTYTFKVNQFTLSQNPHLTQVDSFSGLFAHVIGQNCFQSQIGSPPHLDGQISGTSRADDALNISFAPDPTGWICITENVNPICGNAILLIQQVWTRRYTFSSFSGGIQSGQGCGF